MVTQKVFVVTSHNTVTAVTKVIYRVVHFTALLVLQIIFFAPMARQPYMGLGLLVSSRFHDHTHFTHTTVGRTPLDE
jgi:hypothetical protein